VIRCGQPFTAQPATARVLGGWRHFTVLTLRRRGLAGQASGRAVELRAVLDRRVRPVVPLADLNNPRLWQPGWQPVVRPASMQVIPAIDLLDGQCVRLHQGDYGQVTRFSDDPVAQALRWQDQGAQRLHLVDLDGARTGLPANDAVVKAIVTALAIPVQLGGGIRTAERAEELLAYGLERVILGTAALERPDLVEVLAARHPGRIVVGIDAREGRVATRGWIEASDTLATDLARRLSALPIAAIISTDIGTDGTLAGPNLEALRAMAEASRVPVIASGGVGTLEHLLSLLAVAALGVEGVIVGRALYDGSVDLAEAVQAVGEGRLQDPPGLAFA
jgi:phosphoribosylformimino-5-aminoimidazole carboxamide ribotide isomerase